jgi:hypothetical protein
VKAQLVDRPQNTKRQNQVEFWIAYSILRNENKMRVTKIVSLIHIPIMHRISKAKFGAADIYSGGAGYNSFPWMQQHENGAGPVIDSSAFSSYTPASSAGNHHLN